MRVLGVLHYPGNDITYRIVEEGGDYRFWAPHGDKSSVINVEGLLSHTDSFFKQTHELIKRDIMARQINVREEL